MMMHDDDNGQDSNGRCQHAVEVEAVITTMHLLGVAKIQQQSVVMTLRHMFLGMVCI